MFFSEHPKEKTIQFLAFSGNNDILIRYLIGERLLEWIAPKILITSVNSEETSIRVQPDRIDRLTL